VETIDSVCTYCGTGCEVSAEVEDNTVISMRSKKEAKVSRGRLCVKGKYGFEFLQNPLRINQSRIKKSLLDRYGVLLQEKLGSKLDALAPYNEEYYESPYELSYDIASTLINEITSRNGNDSFAALGGARTSCESSYIFQRFTRKVVGSPNVDNCARVCHSPSLKGMRRTIGEGAATNPFDDIFETECIIVMGSNTTEAHPIVSDRMLHVAKRGTPIITIDVREIPLSKHAELHLSIPFESNLMILNMLAWVILDEGLYNKEFLEERTVGFEEFKLSILNDKYANPDFFQQIKGYEHLSEKVRQAARMYATKKSMFFWGLGITEHLDGSYAVMAITHLALLTGNIGKTGAALMPLRGQNNVQGTCDMGMLPYYDPDYEQPEKIGLMTPDLVDEMLQGNIKVLYNMGEDLAHIHPNQAKMQRALKELDLIIVNEIMENEITGYADIIFGVKSAYEKSGIYINAERRLHLSQPLVHSPLPDDWQVLCEIGNRLGGELNFETSQDVWEDVRRDAPKRFSGASYEKLEKNRLQGMQWPIKEEGTPVLHMEDFRTKDGLGRFAYYSYNLRGQVEELIEKNEYEGFYLTTGRTITHYNNAAQTKAAGKLHKRYSEDVLLMHPEDAKKFSSDRLILTSENGQSGSLKFKASKKIEKGTLFCTFHYAKSKINFLFGDEHDELIKTARFKSVKVTASESR